MTPRSHRPRPAVPPEVTHIVRQLGALLAELGLSEIEVSWADVRVCVRRISAEATAAAAATELTPAAESSPTAITIEAPMVGTFYRASSPSAEPYVSEGDVIKAGQIVCIIEAMKLMNEIESKVGGRVTKVCAENGQAVEYGQPLFLVEPLR